MGAQVYNRMIEQRLHHTPPPIGITAANRPISSSSGSNAARIKRNLFGRVDSTSVKQFVEEQIASQNEEKRKKWNFDFTTGRPDENGSYKWERVTAPVTVSPNSAMVTLTRAAHTSSASSAGRRRGAAPVVDEPLSMQSLMDQRAEKANLEQDDDVSSSPVVEVPEAIRTYPNLRSTTTTTTATVTSATIESLPSTPPSSPTSGSSSSSSSSSSRVTRSRQMRITEFLKERKRLSTGASVGRTQAKKVRLMATMSSNGADPKKAITSPVTRRHSVPSTSSG
uniref:Putative cyclin-dependent kinase inhibitor n=1 Tax=Anopheles marajoara TaxID=58244 RepID=A0A2M4BWD6_9DIPT